MSQLFTSGGQSIGASASAPVLTINIQGWFPLGLTGLVFLLSRGVSTVFCSTTIQKHQFFSAQPSLGSSWSWRDSSECGVKWDLNSPPRNWTWVRPVSRRLWWAEKPGVLQSVGSQRVGNDWAMNNNNENTGKDHMRRNTSSVSVDILSSNLPKFIWGSIKQCLKPFRKVIHLLGYSFWD